MAPDNGFQDIIVALSVFFQIFLVVPGFDEGNLGSDVGRETPSIPYHEKR